MVDHIVRLDIKPLMTYNDGKKRKTTLTSFEKVLAHKENGIVNEEDIKTQAKEERRKLQSTTDRKAGQAVETRTAKTLYADPVTGRAVTYEDVADTKKSQADKASGTGSVSAQSKTTTADSMKTTKYDSYFKKAAAKYGVSESLLKAIAKAESNFNAKSVSGAGAMGVMQLMPDTAKGLGVTDPYDPEQNIMGGANVFRRSSRSLTGTREWLWQPIMPEAAQSEDMVAYRPTANHMLIKYKATRRHMKPQMLYDIEMLWIRLCGLPKRKSV